MSSNSSQPVSNRPLVIAAAAAALTLAAGITLGAWLGYVRPTALPGSAPNPPTEAPVAATNAAPPTEPVEIAAAPERDEREFEAPGEQRRHDHERKHDEHEGERDDD